MKRPLILLAILVVLAVTGAFYFAPRAAGDYCQARIERASVLEAAVEVCSKVPGCQITVADLEKSYFANKDALQCATRVEREK